MAIYNHDNGVITLKAGATSQIVYVFLGNVLTPKTGLVAANATINYAMSNGTQAQPGCATMSPYQTWVSCGFLEIAANDLPGWYAVGLPNACIAAGHKTLIELEVGDGGSDVYWSSLQIQLVAYDPQVATNLGLSCLPTAAPDAAGGLLVGDAAGAAKVQDGTGANQIALTSGAIDLVTSVAGLGTQAKDDVMDNCILALNTASPGSPTSGSVYGEIDVIDGLIDDITTNLSGLTTPPTAVAIRQEMDSNSTKLAAINTKTALLGTGVVQSNSPVQAADRIILVAGDDYLAADTRNLSWTETSTGTFPELTGATVKLEIDQVGSYTCTISGDLGSQSILCDLTAAQTSIMPLGKFKFNILVTMVTTAHIISILPYGGECEIVEQIKYA